MAMSCEQIDAQMIDFLYGELPAAERAAFEAHVAGCARCRSEVDAFGKTRTLARAALDEAPPSRVHDAVMRAAREAAAARLLVLRRLRRRRRRPRRRLRRRAPRSGIGCARAGRCRRWRRWGP